MGPLQGIKVIEIASLGPGPFCGMMLADMGADVVRLDRHTGPQLIPGDPSLDVLNRGKRSIAIDLKHPRAAGVVLDLVPSADVLIEGFRPGVCERLGIGPVECHERNPRLVYGRMTGWGQEGPLAHSAGHDINYLARAGGLWSFGHADRPPMPPLNLVADFGGGGMFLAFGVVAALLGRSERGYGQVVDAAMVDGVAALHAMTYALRAQGAWRDKREANLLDGAAPFYTTYACADGEYVAVGALEPQFYAELVRGLDLDPDEHPQHDRARWNEYRATFGAIFRGQTQREWTARFAGADACVAPVTRPEAVLDDRHLTARATFVKVNEVLQPAPAPRFGVDQPELRSLPPAPGEHTRAALLEWGVDEATLEDLIDAQCVMSRE